MSVYAEVKIVSNGDQIGVFKLDMPENAIAGETKPAEVQRFVTDPANGDVYLLGVAANFVGVAAAEEAPAKAPEVPAKTLKIRDWVRLAATSDHGIPEGTVGKISAWPDKDGDWTVEFPGDWDYCRSGILEPAGPYRVGDRVRVTGNTVTHHYLKVGTVATVIENEHYEHVTAIGENNVEQGLHLDDVEYAL